MNDDGDQITSKQSEPVVSNSYSTENPQLPEEEMRKSRNWSFIKSKRFMYSVASIVLVLVVTAVTIWVIGRSNTNSPTSEQVSPLAVLKEHINKTTGTTLAEVVRSNGPSLVLLNAGSRSWVGLPEGKDILRFNATQRTQEPNQVDYENLVRAVSEKGLHEVETTSAAARSYSADSLVMQFFRSDDIMCNITNRSEDDTATDTKKVYYAQIDCAMVKDFDDAIAAVRPLLQAYANAKDNKGDIVFSGAVATADSINDGYKNAHLNVILLGTDTVLRVEFYQTPQSSDWVYFAAVEPSDVLRCRDYSGGASYAYAGYTCINDSGVTDFVREPVQEAIPIESTGPVTGG